MTSCTVTIPSRGMARCGGPAVAEALMTCPNNDKHDVLGWAGKCAFHVNEARMAKLTCRYCREEGNPNVFRVLKEMRWLPSYLDAEDTMLEGHVEDAYEDWKRAVGSLKEFRAQHGITA